MICGVLLAAGHAQSAEPSFSKDIAPILEQRCSVCHMTGEEPGSMALYADAAYESLVGKPAVGGKMLRVKPGAPTESYLVLKLQGTHLEAGGSGERMPMGGAPLDGSVLKLIEDWIAAGAARN